MNFLLFLIYYFLCTLILFSILFILYKLLFKRIIDDKIAFSLSDFFTTDTEKSILDVKFEEKEKKEDEKIPTYF